jgi:hypothetical protein
VGNQRNFTRAGDRLHVVPQRGAPPRILMICGSQTHQDRRRAASTSAAKATKDINRGGHACGIPHRGTRSRIEDRKTLIVSPPTSARPARRECDAPSPGACPVAARAASFPLSEPHVRHAGQDDVHQWGARRPVRFRDLCLRRLVAVRETLESYAHRLTTTLQGLVGATKPRFTKAAKVAKRRTEAASIPHRGKRRPHSGVRSRMTVSPLTMWNPARAGLIATLYLEPNTAARSARSDRGRQARHRAQARHHGRQARHGPAPRYGPAPRHRPAPRHDPAPRRAPIRSV